MRPAAMTQPTSGSLLDVQTHESEFLVIGSGIAGLWTALNLAGRGHVTVVTKDVLSEGSTLYAQGGVAVAWEHEDS
ncbi:MAG: FAD-dependent oxidoreductase, partial [Armatimonadota bacterium]